MRRGWRPGIGLTLGLLAAGNMAAGDGPAPREVRPALSGNRAPAALCFSPDGSLLYVAEAEEADVAVVDTASGNVRTHFPTGGARPSALACTPDGRELVVANAYGGSVAILATRDGKSRATIPLSGMPRGVAVSPDGKQAYVSVSQLDQVAALDLARATVSARVRVGRRPGPLALTPDGGTLAVAGMAGGTVSVIDTETLAENAQVRLKGVNVRGLCVTRDGREAYVTDMPPFNTKPADDPSQVWHNVVQSVRLEGDASAPGEDQWTDFARVTGTTDLQGSPDQSDIVLDRTGRTAWIAVAGRDLVTRLSVHDPRRNTIWPFSQVETVVGANPRALALNPDETRLWVANYLGNSLSVIDTASGEVVRTVDLGQASRRDPTIPGQYLFNNAGLTRMSRFTCASCHPDGGSDGLTWSFVHVHDGLLRRNSRDLRAEIAETAPFRWSGLEPTLPEFVRNEVTGLLGGAAPTAAQEQALAEAVAAFRLPPNPFRAADGRLTEAAAKGKELFEGKAGCVRCHAGPRGGGTGLRAYVGTTTEERALDVPHLLGVYDSAPYLHDGRAKTLEDVLTSANPDHRHGGAHLLDAAERGDLVRYLQEF